MIVPYVISCRCQLYHQPFAVSPRTCQLSHTSNKLYIHDRSTWQWDYKFPIMICPHIVNGYSILAFTAIVRTKSGKKAWAVECTFRVVFMSFSRKRISEITILGRYFRLSNITHITYHTHHATEYKTDHVKRSISTQYVNTMNYFNF